jgi:hypothetical protein
MEQVVLKPENHPEQLHILANDLRKEKLISEQFKELYKQEDFAAMVLEGIKQGTAMGDIMVAECSDEKRWVYFRGKTYVLDDLAIQLGLIRDHHDKALAGHPARAKTLDLLSQKSYWKTMRKQVD